MGEVNSLVIPEKIQGREDKMSEKQKNHMYHQKRNSFAVLFGLVCFWEPKLFGFFF